MTGAHPKQQLPDARTHTSYSHTPLPRRRCAPAALPLQIPAALSILLSGDLASDPIYATSAASKRMCRLAAGYFLYDRQAKRKGGPAPLLGAAASSGLGRLLAKTFHGLPALACPCLDPPWHLWYRAAAQPA